MIIIIVHEFGHFFIAILFGFKVDKIYIYPLGGLTKFSDLINRPLYQEVLVTIMGPVFQIIISIILSRFDRSVLLFNNLLLLFNLLPILPLDGGKLFSLFISSIISYKKSLRLVILISYVVYIFSFVFIIYLNSLFFIIVFLLLVFKIYEESININYLYHKFLIERLLYDFNFKKSIVVSSLFSFYKYKKNTVIKNNKIYSEKDIINDYLSNQNIVK